MNHDVQRALDALLNAPLDAAPRRVLIVDDNEQIHADFRKVLCPSTLGEGLEDDEAALFGDAGPPEARPPAFDVDFAAQGVEGFEKVRRAVAEGRPYLLAFVDMRMPPGWDGVETIEKLWTVDPELQVVICTAYSDHSWGEVAARLGQTDRLLVLKKPFDDVEVTQLATALTAKWFATRDAVLKQSELERLVDDRTSELRRAALTDGLTGLPNRPLFIERLAAALRRGRDDPAYRFAVMFLDFDRFKLVNDTFGHGVGDRLLSLIAARLTAAVRRTDLIAVRDPQAVAPSTGDATVARVGGDEFLVLVDGLAEHRDAEIVAQRLLDALAGPYQVAGHEVRSTASIGVTTNAVAYGNADDVIRDADTAMYFAKANGRALFALFDQKMHDRAAERVTLERDLRGAAERGELSLAYQPIVRTSSGELRGVEALVRWHHPARGLVVPADFVPLAEECGLIHGIGAWVLDEACRQAAAWRSHPSLRRVPISVNLSRLQLVVPGFTDEVAAALQRHGLAADAMRLEVTESAVMHDVEPAVRALKRLRAMGFELEMDDFGTGHSSLSCLHRFPLSGIKIDRSFVAHLGEDDEHAAIVKSVVALARGLGLSLVAEGVETQRQLELLESWGCDLAQGFLFAKAMPASEVERFEARPIRAAA